MNRERALLALGLALVASLVLHAVVGIVVRDALTAPELDFDFELPDAVELGMTEELEAELARVTSEPNGEQESASAASTTGSVGVAVGDAATSHDAGIADGGFTDGAVIDGAITDGGVEDEGISDGGARGRRDGGRRRHDAGVDAGALVAESAGGPGGTGTSRVPAGAQIALRLDLTIVRGSPLARDVAQLLQAIPDWQLVLNGSDLDPLTDLDRVLLASPNLQRSQIVMAGEHAHAAEGEDGTAWMRGVVERFGAARGVPTPWREALGVTVAPWPNEDATERLLAILGPRHFALCRPEDLARVLAIAEARDAAMEQETVEAARARGAAALLAMEPDEALSLEVEGARSFLGRRGDPTRFPARLSASMRRDGERAVRLRARARFDDEAQAERAAAYWNEQREALAGQTVVALLGFSGPLRGANMTQEGLEITVEATLTLRQVRAILGFLEGAVRRPATARGAASSPRESSATPAPRESPATH